MDRQRVINRREGSRRILSQPIPAELIWDPRSSAEPSHLHEAFLLRAGVLVYPRWEIAARVRKCRTALLDIAECLAGRGLRRQWRQCPVVLENAERWSFGVRNARWCMGR